MQKNVIFTIFLLIFSISTINGQVKLVQKREQIWIGYFNQMRFHKNWGTWFDIHLRTLDNFTDQYSQSLYRVGLTYYIRENKRITAGYTFSEYYPADNHKKITLSEHRPWQQLVFQTKWNETNIKNTLRTEQRIRNKITSDSTLSNKWYIQHRLRYAFGIEVPIRNSNGQWWALMSNEMMLQMDNNFLNGVFDQNRFYAGIQYKLSPETQFQMGFMNILQQGSPHTFKYTNVIRLYCMQQFDVRKK